MVVSLTLTLVAQGNAALWLQGDILRQASYRIRACCNFNILLNNSVKQFQHCLIVCACSSLLTLRCGLFEGERHCGRCQCRRQRTSSAISSRSRRTPRPVQTHAVRSKRAGDGYSWRKCRRSIKSTCISLCHECSCGFLWEDRTRSRKNTECTNNATDKQQ